MKYEDKKVMPHYDYQCNKCHHTEEYFQKITEEPLKTCPKCQAEAFQRRIGGAGATFRFKGSGFYITDYPTSSPKQEPAKAVDTPKGGCGCSGSHSCN